MFNICAPTIMYIIFSITQILIDIYNGSYSNIVQKSIVTIMVSLLLNILCDKGFSIVAWLIVFIPFLLMTFLVAIILYVFGLDIASGNTDYKCDNIDSSVEDIKTDKYGNILIYDPEYNKKVGPVYYKYPNIIVPNPHKNDDILEKKYDNIFSYSSSPAYQS